MSHSTIVTAIIEGLSLAVTEIQDESLKRKLIENIERLEKYIKVLESGITNRDQVIAELNNEIEKLRNLLKDKGVL